MMLRLQRISTAYSLMASDPHQNVYKSTIYSTVSLAFSNDIREVSFRIHPVLDGFIRRKRGLVWCYIEV